MSTTNNEIFFHQYIRRGRRNEKRGVIVVKINPITGVANVGWSLCSGNDDYDRTVGFDIALARMNLISMNPKNPDDQQRVVDLMPHSVYKMWLDGGVFNRIMMCLDNYGSRIPLDSYVSGHSHFADSGSLNGVDEADNADHEAVSSANDSYYRRSSFDNDYSGYGEQ
jgi:hypothetical protein